MIFKSFEVENCVYIFKTSIPVTRSQNASRDKVLPLLPFRCIYSKFIFLPHVPFKNNFTATVYMLSLLQRINIHYIPFSFLHQKSFVLLGPLSNAVLLRFGLAAINSCYSSFNSRNKLQ